MLRATYEHNILVDSFKNIDHFNQSLYYLRFMIKSNGEQASPYNYFESTNNSKKKESCQQSQIDEQYFQTKTFMIRFQEEKVEIVESCVLRLEVSASPCYEHEFKLIYELMCADLAKIGGPPNEESLFKCVATFQGRICNSYKGVHEYVPIMFDNNHFCQFHCTVNSNLQDFKFCLREFQKANSSRIRHLQNFFINIQINLTIVKNFLIIILDNQDQQVNLCKNKWLKCVVNLSYMINYQNYPQYPNSHIFNTRNLLLLKKVFILKVIFLFLIDQNLLSTLIENDINQYSSVLFELQNLIIKIIQNNIELQYNKNIKQKQKINGEKLILEKLLNVIHFQTVLYVKNNIKMLVIKLEENQSQWNNKTQLKISNNIVDWIKNNPFRISFIDHSMGGLIVRAAQPHLSEFKINMNTYISLSSPHQGYGYNNSLLIDAGLWFLKRMTMTDAEQIENTFLFQLSRQEGFNWFQNILFVSSAQDTYVPFESARISKNFERSDQNSRKYEKMVDNIFNGMRATQVRRLDVNFLLNQQKCEYLINQKLNNRQHDRKICSYYVFGKLIIIKNACIDQDQIFFLFGFPIPNLIQIINQIFGYNQEKIKCFQCNLRR